MSTYFRIQSHDPQSLLDPEMQWSINYSTDSEKRGVSATASYEDLLAYVAQTGLCAGEPGAMLIEMEADESDEDDDDAEMGALLVFPTKIIAATPIDETSFHEDIEPYL